MARRLIGSTRAGQVLAIAACCLVLATGCARTQAPPVRATGGSESVQQSGSAPQPPPSADGAGNGGGAVPSGSVGNGGGNGGGGGGNGGDGGNQAAGSPIDVPAIPATHQLLADVRDGIRQLFVDACGGQDLCVTLEFGDGACFLGYDPADRALRGSTVKVLTGSLAECGAGGAPAVGSPIDVPTVPEQHTPLVDQRDFIERSFIEACGGQDLCVTLEYGDGACFTGYDPAAQAARGSTVKVLTESQADCDRANGLPGPGSATDATSPVPTPSTDLTTSGTNGGTSGSGQPDGSSR